MAALALLLLSAFAVSAQEAVTETATEEEAKDFLEIALYGGYVSPSGGLGDFKDSVGAKSGWSVGIDVGYFATPNLAIGLNFSYAQLGIKDFDGQSGLSHRFYNPFLYGKYYFFSESKFAPFIKGMIGLHNAKFTTLVNDLGVGQMKYRQISYEPSLAIGIAGGAFYYTSDYSGLFVEAEYQMGFSEDSKAEYQGQNLTFGENTGLLNLNAGIKVFFGSE